MAAKIVKTATEMRAKLQASLACLFVFAKLPGRAKLCLGEHDYQCEQNQ
jgi:hypothetical protein